MVQQLLLAPYRVTFNYVVSSLPHKLHVYCAAVGSIDPEGYDITGQNTPVDSGFSTIDGVVFNAMKPFYNPANDSFGQVELHKRDGTSWVFKAAFATAIVPTGSSSPNPSMGYCVSGKDYGNRFLPYYIYEGAFGATQKNTSYAALNANNKALVDAFYNVGLGAAANAPWNWALSKDATQLPDRWLASIVDSNQKLRRLRHIT